MHTHIDDFEFIYDEDSSKIKKEIQKYYGKIAAITWRRLNLGKFVSKFNYIDYRKNFYRNLYLIIARLFFKQESKRINNTNHGESFDKLRSFINCLPSLKILIKTIKKIDFENSSSSKDIVFVKLLIEILNYYYMKFDFPLFKVNNSLRFLEI